MNRRILAASTALTAAAGLSLLASAAHAQDAAANPPYRASIAVDEYYTDNVFFSRPLYDQRRLGDWVTVIRPSLGYDYRFDKGAISFGASAAIGRYAKYTSENYFDFGLDATGRYRFDPLTTAVWGLGLTRGHEPRSSLDPSDQIGTEPTTYWKTSAFGAIQRRIGTDTLKLGFTYDGYNFQDSSTTVAPYTINNDDRDRDMMTFGARYTHPLAEGTRIFAEGTLDWRNYRQSRDDNGYARDSLGGRANVGLQQDVGKNARAEVYGGFLYQNYRDARFDAVVAPDFGGRYTWQSNGTSVEARLDRTLEETTLAGISSYLQTTASLNVSQDLQNRIRLYGGASLADLNFQNSARSDQLTNLWIGARKYLTPRFYVGAEAGFEERDSSDPTEDYTATRIMARVGIDSGRAFDPTKAANLGEAATGFYVGAGGSLDHVGTMLDGPRQETNGSLTTDFGKVGAGGRLLAGWGADVNRTYFGVEGDVGLSEAEWNHARKPGGRVFSVRQNDDFGFSLLGGRRVGGGTLVYGRAGIRSTRFDTEYATAGASDSWSDRRTGFEYGLGVRTPITPNLALSLEYVQDRYPDYTAGVGKNPPDRFANVVNSARFDLTYHFGGIPGAVAPKPATADFSGAYWGVQAGLGTLDSKTQGDRQPEGAPPVTSVLTADFGDNGYTLGGLAGYNFQMGRFVFGGEAEADFAHERWDHQRMTSGRTFSLRKDASLGLSARAGYVLDGGALLYGRVGAAASLLDNTFSTPGVSLSQNEWHGGIRYGGGIEVPVSRKSRIRFDYTVTDYGTLSLDTPSGRETYRTSENTFRLGYIRKF